MSGCFVSISAGVRDSPGPAAARAYPRLPGGSLKGAGRREGALVHNRWVTADDDHRELDAAWGQLFHLIDGLPSRLRWGDVHHLDVADMADRVRGLGLYLDSAVRLSSQMRYEPAFALLRSALEQSLVDWLVFQGRTLVQRFKGVGEEQWAAWQKDRAAGADWTSTIRDWSRTKKGDVRVVREGLFSEPDEHGDKVQMSIYYFLLDQYQPTLGPPSAQMDTSFVELEDLRRVAGENDALWRTYLTWSSLLTNLQENALVNDADMGRLAVHYRFLSGYAHPVVDHRRETYGRDASMGWPRYDHYCSELVLLYALALGALEVRNFPPVLDTHPGASLADPDQIDEVLRAAESSASHFWFLGTNVHSYDVWQAHNQASFRLFKAGQLTVPTAPAPDKIPYPVDPLRRLIEMHRNTEELLTGLYYQSAWPREDAWFR